MNFAVLGDPVAKEPERPALWVRAIVFLFGVILCAGAIAVLALEFTVTFIWYFFISTMLFRLLKALAREKPRR